MVKTKNPYSLTIPERFADTLHRGWTEGYRQALFDAAKELSDHGHLLAAQRLIDAANED